MTQPRAHYFPGLDPLRAFAALSVLAFHVFGVDGWVALPAHGPLAWLRGGWVGLDLFFVISGLVVGQSALLGFAREGRGFWRRFAVHRLARIAPLYLVTAIAWLTLVDAGPILGADRAAQVLSHVFFVHNLMPSTAMSIDPPSWSLAAEMQLYVLLALATPLLARVRSPALVAAVAIAIALAWRATVCALLSGADAALLQHAAYQTPGMLDSFGLGVAAAIAFRANADAVMRPALAALLIAAGLLALGLGAIVTPAVVDGSIWSHPLAAIPMRTAIALAALAVVAGCAALPLRAGSRATAAIRHAGDLSYGLYLWHYVALGLLTRYTSLRGFPLLAAVLALTVPVAELTRRCVERPVMRRVAARAPSPVRSAATP